MLTVCVVSVVFVMSVALSAFGQELKPIKLPEPKLDPSKSLAQALKDRKTTREYGGDLSPQMLSNLLWAAFGINRSDSGKRTAPSAKNWQEIDVYVATKQGTYLYDPKRTALVPVLSGDFRSLTYTQADRFKEAPIHLVYISDLAKTDGEEGAAMLLTAMDTGFIAENVYLYCASEGLPTAFRVAIDKPNLGQAMSLRPTQRIMGAQSVGLPKGK
jgi:nitroreductase